MRTLHALAALALVAAPSLAARIDLWDSTETVWKTPAELQFELAPLLDQGLMPVLNHVADGEAWRGRRPELSLLDLAAGTPKWTVPTGSDVNSMAAAGDLMVLTTAGIAAVEPAIVGACRVSDGEVVWQMPLEANLDTGGDLSPVFRQIRWFGDRWARSQGIGGGVAVEGDRVFLKVGERAFCLSRQTGEPLWGTDVGFSLAAPLTPCGKLLLAAIQFHGLRALDQETGDILWSTPIDKISRIYAFEDAIYVATSDGWFGRLDPTNGAPMWQVPGASTFVQFAMPIGDKIVLRVPDRVWILDATTGAEELNAATAQECSAVSEETLYYSPTVQPGTQAVEIVAVSVADHAEKWRIPLDGQPSCLRWLAGNLLIISASDIWGLRPDDGSLAWEWHVPMGGGFIDPDTLAGEGNRVYFRAFKWLAGFDTETGACFLEAPGDVFFVHWMRLEGDNLSMHDGKQAAAEFINVRLRKGEAEETEK